MKPLAALRILLVVLSVIEISMEVLALTTPITVFSGGIRGYVSLTNHEIYYLGEKVPSGVLDYVNTIALISSIAIALQILATLLIARGLPLILSFAFTLPSIPFQAILRGLTYLAKTEISTLTFSTEIQTTAGKITFPPLTVRWGYMETIMTLQIIIAIPLLALLVTGILMEAKSK
jgi:hypothetical protein